MFRILTKTVAPQLPNWNLLSQTHEGLPFGISFYFWPHCTARGILAPWPGTELISLAVEPWSLSHQTAKAVPRISYFTVKHLYNKSSSIKSKIGPNSHCINHTIERVLSLIKHMENRPILPFCQLIFSLSPSHLLLFLANTHFSTKWIPLNSCPKDRQ